MADSLTTAPVRGVWQRAALVRAVAAIVEDEPGLTSAEIADRIWARYVRGEPELREALGEVHQLAFERVRELVTDVLVTTRDIRVQPLPRRFFLPSQRGDIWQWYSLDAAKSAPPDEREQIVRTLDAQMLRQVYGVAYQHLLLLKELGIDPETRRRQLHEAIDRAVDSAR